MKKSSSPATRSCFSNHWKIFAPIFQSLEKKPQRFPIIGKAVLTAMLMLAAANAWAATGWFEDYVVLDVNSTTGEYYWIGADPSFGTQFHEHDFGSVTQFVIGGCDMKYWSDTQDRTGGSYFWSVDGGAATEAAWNQEAVGGNDYQGTSAADQNILSGLRAGTHRLSVWAKSTGTGQGDSWLSNGGNNYTATFAMVQSSTILPSDGPQAGGNTVTITNAWPAIGNGSDITNILVGAMGTTNLLGQGANWATFVAPANSAGVKDVVVQTSGSGDATLGNAYTVNPAGKIIAFDWTRWQEVAGLPDARYYHAAAVLNSELYALGGWDDSGSTVTNMYRYDGTAWTEVEGLPGARRSLAAGVLNGALYAVGGLSDTLAISTNVYRYDGTNWTEVAGLPAAREDFAAAVLNGELYVMGGYNSTVRTNVYRYNGTVWTETAGLTTSRRTLAADVLNGELYAVGGLDGSGTAKTNLYQYNGTHWAETAGLPAARYGLAVGTVNGELYAVGGYDGAHAQSTNVYRYNGTNWLETLGLPDARSSHAAGVLEGGVYVIGGLDDQSDTMTNVFRYPALAPDVSPASGSSTGGCQVIVSGVNLGNGADITNVTLCGASVQEISSQSATQVVVVARADDPGLGDVRVYSISFGETVKSNAFTYTGSGILISSPSFGYVPLGAVVTNVFTVTNSGNEALLISAATNDGPGATNFIVNLPATVSPGTASNFPVVFTAGAMGTFNPVCYTVNNSLYPNYYFGLYGSVYQLSTNAGPSVGGNTLTITNGQFGAITNVLVGGVSAAIQSWGTNWAIVTIPTGLTSGAKDIAIQTADNGDLKLADAYTVNPAGAIGFYTNTWQEVSGLPAGRLGHGVAAYSNAIYAAGGYTCQSNVYRFDGATWTEAAPLPEARRNMPLCAYNGLLYGVAGTDPALLVTATVFAFNGSNWSSSLPVLPAPRTGVALAMHAGYLCAAGGYVSGAQQEEAWRFNGSSWEAITNLPDARDWPILASFHGQLYCVGGNGLSGISATNVYRYDGDSWSEVSGLPSPRFGMAASVLSDKLYIFGGLSNTTARGEVFSFDGTNWQTEASLPAARARPGGAVLGRQMYCVGGGTTASSGGQTNVYCYPAWNVAGVTPSNGAYSGGYEVTIGGLNLGDGGDITNVTLCGVSVQEITSQSATQIVVVAGVADAGQLGLGDVRVFSTSFGETIQANAFAYKAPNLQVRGTNGSLVASGNSPSWTDGTKFRPTLFGAAWTSAFSITNSGDAALNISGYTTNGANPSLFAVGGVPLIVDVGGVSNFTVVYTPASVGSHSASVAFTSDDLTSPFTLNLGGSCFALSTNVGPSAGGNTITLTNGNFGAITNVLVGGVSAAIQSSGANWAIVTIPAGLTPGAKDIVIQTSDQGDTTLSNAYTVNPAGAINVGHPSSWTDTMGLSATRYAVAVAELSNNLYVMGGAIGVWSSASAQTNVYQFDGTNWTEAAGLPVSRYLAGSATYSGQVYVVGGYDTAERTNVYRFDGANWTEMAGLPSVGGRAGPAVCVWSNHLYAIAGSANKPSASGATNVFRFNGAVWEEVHGLPAASFGMVAGVLNGALYAAGGYNPSGYRTNCYRYDGVNWTEVFGLPAGLVFAGGAVLSEHLYAIGGEGPASPAGQVYRFNGTAWTLDSSLPGFRDNAGAGVLNGTLFAIGGRSSSEVATTNVYRYNPAVIGVSPSTGLYTGGYQVVIPGSNLCNGADVTNVTLCGVNASSIVSQSATQIVVVAGVADAGQLGLGDVRVFSVSYGETVQAGAFTYTAPSLNVRGTNGAAVASGNTPSWTDGTKFRPTLFGAAWTSAFSITNSGDAALNISGYTTNGADPSLFAVGGVPLIVDVGGVSNFTVVYTPASVGSHSASVAFTSDDLTSPFTLNLGGSCFVLSTNVGPYAGGNTITLTNGNFGAITNVLVGGVSAAIQSSGANWATITIPAVGSAGVKDIVVQTSDQGDTTLAGAYTVYPAGQISGGLIPGHAWTNLGSGVNDGVSALLHDGTNLYAGGEFTNAGGVAVNCIAMWNGASWTNLGSGLGGSVVALTHNGANLYAGGYFTNIGGVVMTSSVAMWNGTSWTNLGDGLGGSVMALAHNGTNLYAGSSDGTVAMWNPAGAGSWTNFDGIHSTVWALMLDGTNLYAGSSQSSYVQLWNGASWTSLGDGLDSQANALAHDATNLYVGGWFSAAGDVTANGVAAWNPAGAGSWTNLGSGMSGGMSAVLALAHDGVNLYAGGFFTSAGGVAANGVAMWNPAGAGSWTNLGSGVDTYVSSLAHDGINLYAGGFFTNAGGVAANYVAQWRPTVIELSGVSPSSGSWTGGYPVVIVGTNLGNGSDITNVTLCGVSANILPGQSATQVVVVAGASGAGLGDVRIFSISFGETVRSNAFTYMREHQAPLVFSPASPQTYLTTNSLSLSGGSGAGAVSYEVVSGPGQIAGTNLTATAGTGTIAIRATKAQDDHYYVAVVTSTVTAAQASQTIAFDPIADQKTTNNVGLSATTSSGLGVSFSVLSGSASLDGTNLTFS
ncbi:MAG TPA: hypothetical protein DCZ95_19635, partial [Verrucomicrobia bacterium]|nr:hypothetical protein [Verrucomicrobiota bacterium]